MSLLTTVNTSHTVIDTNRYIIIYIIRIIHIIYTYNIYNTLIHITQGVVKSGIKHPSKKYE